MGGRDETELPDGRDVTSTDAGPERAPQDGPAADGTPREGSSPGEPTGDGDRTASSVADGERLAPPGVWKRWVDGKDNLHLHRFSSILPQVRRRDGSPYVEFLPEGPEPPTFTDPDTGETREFVFVGGWTRQVLRHTPLVILLAAIVLFVGAEFSDPVVGLSELFPVLDDRLLIVLVWALFIPILGYLFSTADIIGGGDRSFFDMVSVYGLPIVLAGGVAISVVLVVAAPDPTGLAPNVVYVSGYLLTMLVGGQLFYDTILRTENLIVDLPETRIVNHEDDYYRLVTEMADSLQTTVLGVPAATVFGFVFAIQFGGLWTIADGPQHLGFGLNVAVNTALNVVLVVATFQFIVVVRYLNELFSDEGEYSHVLGYEPFHVDGRAGYRDLGRFAIRYNVLIGLGALYIIYRLYATGSRALLGGGLDSFTHSFDMLVWMINYGSPVLVFGAVLLAWVYLGFWSMHRKMMREKDRISWAFQGDPKTDGDAGAGVPIREMENGPTYQYVVNAPEWPVQPQRLTGIITGTFLPLLLPLPELLL